MWDGAWVLVIEEALAAHWGLTSVVLTPLAGGINSDTWLVEHDRSRYVVKAVPDGGLDDLVAGADAATVLSRAGLVTGRPVPTRDGRVVAEELGLVLLEHVPGRELTGESDLEQERIARALAAVHTAGDPHRGPDPGTFGVDWLSLDAPGVSDHTWLVSAVAAVRAETDGLPLTWSLLHTDPVPDAFIHDEHTEVTGVIDWAGSRRGPVLYDVASAVMYLGGRANATPFLSTYVAEGPLSADELAHLDAFSRFREAVQGAYFARRLATDDLTGGIDRADNQKGLDDAKRRLEALPRSRADLDGGGG